jgi:hypothetical protein
MASLVAYCIRAYDRIRDPLQVCSPNCVCRRSQKVACASQTRCIDADPDYGAHGPQATDHLIRCLGVGDLVTNLVCRGFDRVPGKSDGGSRPSGSKKKHILQEEHL